MAEFIKDGKRANRYKKIESDMFRKKWLKIRANDEELERYRQVAKARGLTVAELVRTVIQDMPE